MSKVWFITGSSRGLGRALTEAVLEKGDRVIATAQAGIARRPQVAPRRAAAAGRARRHGPGVGRGRDQGGMDAFGRLDVQVNNAGYGSFGAFEEISADDIWG
jgi:NAD(P)-dependent dehydrogenase (short-subunit alcohol dehydrogenase family)